MRQKQTVGTEQSLTLSQPTLVPQTMVSPIKKRVRLPISHVGVLPFSLFSPSPPMRIPIADHLIKSFDILSVSSFFQISFLEISPDQFSQMEFSTLLSSQSRISTLFAHITLKIPLAFIYYIYISTVMINVTPHIVVRLCVYKDHSYPSFVSFTLKPKAVNSFRILSLVAQSLLALACFLISKSKSTAPL